MANAGFEASIYSFTYAPENPLKGTKNTINYQENKLQYLAAPKDTPAVISKISSYTDCA